MTLILPDHLNKFPMLGDLGFKSPLYFINPMESITSVKVLILKSVTDHAWDIRLEELLKARAITKGDYVDVEYFAPKYAETLINKEYIANFKENEVSNTDKLGMVPTGKILCPKIATQMLVLKTDFRTGLMPNIYFTSKRELEIWVKKSKHTLSTLPRRR